MILGFIGFFLLAWRTDRVQRRLAVPPPASPVTFPPRDLRGWARYLAEFALALAGVFAFFNTTSEVATAVATVAILTVAYIMYKRRIADLRLSGASSAELVQLLALLALALLAWWWFLYQSIGNMYRAV